MLDLNWSDVVSTLQSLQNYLIAIGVILALAILATVACLKLARHQKFMIRCQAWIAALIAIVVVVNIICTGPMYTLLSLISGTGTLTQETSDAAVLRVEEIADEGIVLLENQQNLLPLAPNSNVNVFGWASTNPCYGGTGSGALNDNFPKVTLLAPSSTASPNPPAEHLIPLSLIFPRPPISTTLDASPMKT